MQHFFKVNWVRHDLYDPTDFLGFGLVAVKFCVITYPAKNINKNQLPGTAKHKSLSSNSTSPIIRHGMHDRISKLENKNIALAGACFSCFTNAFNPWFLSSSPCWKTTKLMTPAIWNGTFVSNVDVHFYHHSRLHIHNNSEWLFERPVPLPSPMPLRQVHCHRFHPRWRGT